MSATQNSTSNFPWPPAKTTAKPRASRAKAPASEAKSARVKSPRASAKAKGVADPVEAAGEVVDAPSVSLEQALLEKESAKSLSVVAAHKNPCKARCGQCGREMRFVPFSLSNLMCRSCYGLDRYRRPVAPTTASAPAPSSTSR
jgi:hypothetical protein